MSYTWRMLMVSADDSNMFSNLTLVYDSTLHSNVVLFLLKTLTSAYANSALRRRSMSTLHSAVGLCQLCTPTLACALL